MTIKEFELKKKDFKQWARNDAKSFIIHKDQKKDETVQQYYASCIAVYNIDRLIKTFDYTELQAEEILSWYNECFWQGFEYWNKRYNEVVESVLQRYRKVFKEAELIAEKVDVKDLSDGFPCGSAHLYLNPEESDTDLGKALSLKNDANDSIPYKYKLPIKMPSYGQCIDFDMRICEEVKEFLLEKDIPCLIHSWID